MPTDPVTEMFVGQTADKVVMDLGSGLGQATALPALEQGARAVFATDVSAGDLDHIRHEAEGLGRQAAVQTHLLDPAWWDRPLSANPTLGAS